MVIFASAILVLWLIWVTRNEALDFHTIAFVAGLSLERLKCKLQEDAMALADKNQSQKILRVINRM